jgi:hypothetical protein
MGNGGGLLIRPDPRPTVPRATPRPVSVHRFAMSALRGKGRIWGSGDLGHWANLDPRRPRKSVGFLVDLGRHVVPFLTPDDPDTFEQVLRRHVHPDPSG